MTTNKPDIQAFLMKQDGHYDPYVSIQRDSGCTGMVYPLVRLCDYEALQADRDQQYDMKVKAREQRDEVTTKLSALYAECEKWKCGSEIRDEQNQDLHSFVMELKAECENLRKDAERYQIRIEVIRNLYPGAPSDTELDIAINAAIQDENK